VAADQMAFIQHHPEQTHMALDLAMILATIFICAHNLPTM
jgi:hypothetical protein